MQTVESRRLSLKSSVYYSLLCDHGQFKYCFNSDLTSCWLVLIIPTAWITGRANEELYAKQWSSHVSSVIADHKYFYLPWTFRALSVSVNTDWLSFLNWLLKVLTVSKNKKQSRDIFHRKWKVSRTRIVHYKGCFPFLSAFLCSQFPLFWFLLFP